MIKLAGCVTYYGMTQKVFYQKMTRGNSVELSADR
jgi:hypothetical protein